MNLSTKHNVGDIVFAEECEDWYGEYICGVVTRKIDDHYFVKPLNSLDPREEVEVWVFEETDETE